MPRGVYLLTGRPEAFSCAPGPAGWRYVSDTLDLAVDSRFEVVRFVVRSGKAWARGGRTSLDDGQRLLTWTCSPDPDHERTSLAGSVDAGSPGSLVALLRRVASPGSSQARAVVPVVRFAAPALGGLDARLLATRVGAVRHQAPEGQLLVEEWHVDDPDAGTRVVVHVAGDVVLAAEGAGVELELTSLESPPTGVSRTEDVLRRGQAVAPPGIRPISDRP